MITANVATDPTRHFEVDPAALVAAHKGARSGGAQVIGYFHSHPNGLARPSATDAATSARDGAVVARQAAELQRRLDQLSRILADAPALGFGLGDCGLSITLEWLDGLDAPLGLGLAVPPVVADWRARVGAVPAVAAELAAYRPVLHGWLKDALA